MKLIVDLIKKQQDAEIQSHPQSKSGPALAQDTSPIDQFRKAFESYWLETVDKSRFVEADGFHPSALGSYSGNCTRQQVYLLRGVEKVNTFDSRTLRVLDSGNRIHEKLQKALKDMGILISDEIPIEWDDPPVKGHADGALKWLERVILLEIKSCNANTFEMRRKWKKPKPEHFAQANIYAYILGMEVIWIIYYCKDNEEYEIFELQTDRKAAEKILDKWRKTYQTYLAGDLPKRPYKADSKECISCPMRQICWESTEPGV